MFLCVLFPLSLVHINAAEMGVQTVEVTAAAVATPPAVNDVEKGNIHWGKNMQRWRNDNIDIAKGSCKHFISYSIACVSLLLLLHFSIFPLSFGSSAPSALKRLQNYSMSFVMSRSFSTFWDRKLF